MGPKRKIRGARAEAPPDRSAIRCTCTRKGDEDTSGTTDSPQNSGMAEPKVEVDEDVKVEVDENVKVEVDENVKVEIDENVKVEELDSESEPSVVADNQQFLSEFNNEEPEMDNGEVQPKLMRQFKEENQDEYYQGQGGLVSNATNMTSPADPGQPVEGHHANEASSTSSRRKVNSTTVDVECENFDATEEGGENTGDSFNSTYWKLKAEELASQKRKSDKMVNDLESKLLIQTVEADNKIDELEASVAYWKGRAEELERKFLEEVKRAQSDRLSDPQSDAANCTVIAVQSTSTGSSVKSDFLPTSSIPSMDGLSNNKDNEGKGNAHDSTNVKNPLLHKNYEKKLSNAECEMEKVEESRQLMVSDNDVNMDSLEVFEKNEKIGAAEICSQKLKPEKPRVRIQKPTANVGNPADNELGTIHLAAVIEEESPDAEDTSVVGSGITEQGIIIQSASASVTEQDSPNSESLLGNADDSERTDLPREEESHDGENPRKKLRTRSQNKRLEIKGKKTTAAEIRALSQQISGNKLPTKPGQKIVTPQPSFNSKTGKYKCGDCAAEFSHKQGYHCHYKSLHLKVRFKCVTCGKQFSKQGHYVRHQKSAHLKLRIKCDTCGAQFTDRSDRNRHHKSVHAGIRHVCQNCKKSFTRPGEVRKHQRATDCGKKLGLGLAPEHTCHLCAKSFHTKNNLKIHMDGVHYKLGEYSCSICGKIYNTKMSYNRHRREVHLKRRKGKPE